MNTQPERPTPQPAIHPVVADKLPQVRELCRKHHVRTLWLFGSAAQGGFDPAKSDLDFAVEYLPESVRGFDGDWWVLKESLEMLFGRKVDLVAVEAIRNRFLKEAVERTRVELYPHLGKPRPIIEERRPLTVLEDIRNAAMDIQRCTAGKSFDAFHGDDMMRSATERSLGIIGSAIGRLNDERRLEAVRLLHGDRIVGLREVLAHDYDSVRYDEVWATIHTDLPKLLAEVEELLRSG
jgi:hypothetical protein